MDGLLETGEVTHKTERVVEMAESMKDIYERYGAAVHRARMVKGSFEVDHETLEHLFGFLDSFEDEDLGPVLTRFRRRLLRTLMCAGDAEPLPEVRPARFILVE